jgi:protocatechuate 4,5-dioxygenase alpha chain
MPDPISREYEDIPGTFVFDSAHSRKGYALNMFCMSLNVEANRQTFRDEPDEYLGRFKLTAEQRKAIVDRDWLEMLNLGGNIYYTFKLAIFDGHSMQHVGGAMSGITTEEFARMMVEGGRGIEGNRSKSEWKDR